eukprot:25752-Lingulodinium_polyedra.AAC.1
MGLPGATAVRPANAGQSGAAGKAIKRRDAASTMPANEPPANRMAPSPASHAAIRGGRVSANPAH